MSIQLTVLIS